MLSVDGTFIVIFLSFFVFMMLMKSMYFAPIMKIKHEREAAVETGLQASAEAESKMKALLEEQERKLADVRRQAQHVVQEKREQAKKTAGEHLGQRRQEVLAQVESQSANLKRSQEEVYDTLLSERDALAQTIVQKISSGHSKSAIGASSSSAV